MDVAGKWEHMKSRTAVQKESKVDLTPFAFYLSASAVAQADGTGVGGNHRTGVKSGFAFI